MFDDAPGGSYAWAYARGGQPNAVNNYAGAVPLGDQTITSPTTPATSLDTATVLSIVLDTRETTPGFWNAEWFLDGFSLGSYDYDIFTTDITNIKSVGFGAAGPVVANVDSFTLSYVPEPTSALAGILLVGGLLRRRR
jgi:hypothetical protein